MLTPPRPIRVPERAPFVRNVALLGGCVVFAGDGPSLMAWVVRPQDAAAGIPTVYRLRINLESPAVSFQVARLTPRRLWNTPDHGLLNVLGPKPRRWTIRRAPQAFSDPLSGIRVVVMGHLAMLYVPVSDRECIPVAIDPSGPTTSAAATPEPIMTVTDEELAERLVASVAERMEGP